MPSRSLALDAKQSAPDVEYEVITEASGKRPEHADPAAGGLTNNRELRKGASLIRRELHLDSLVV
jgi:hypothetical protein